MKDQGIPNTQILIPSEKYVDVCDVTCQSVKMETELQIENQIRIFRRSDLYRLRNYI